MKERMVPAQQLSDAGEDLVRLAAAKDAEIATLKADRDRWMADNKRLGQALINMNPALSQIAALTEQRDGYKRDYEDTRDCLNNERAKFMELLNGLTEQRDELRRQNAEKADLLDRCIALFRRNGDYPTLTQEIVAALTSAPQAASPSLPESPTDG